MRYDPEVSVEMLEDLQARTLRVVPEQSVEVFEPRSNPAGRPPREIQAGVFLEHGQLEMASLKRGLNRLEFGSHGERIAAGQEVDEIPGLTFEAKDLRLQLAGSLIVRVGSSIDLHVYCPSQHVDDRSRHLLTELRDERAFEPVLAIPDAMSADGRPLVGREGAPVPACVVDVTPLSLDGRLRSHPRSADATA
jgi:hypothetical protein